MSSQVGHGESGGSGGGGGGGGPSMRHSTALYDSTDLIPGPPRATSTSGPEQRLQQDGRMAGGSANVASQEIEMPSSANSASAIYQPDYVKFANL